MNGDRARTKVGGRMATAIAVALCSLASGGSAPALADAPAEFATGTPAFEQAREIARAYWGVEACGGTFTVSWLPVEGTINARSGWANLRSQYDHPELNTSCVITFNSAQTWNWKRFCSILVHEYGHLTGHPHTETPGDIMNTYYDRPVPECAARGDQARAAAQGPLSPGLPLSEIAGSATATPAAPAGKASAKRAALRSAARAERRANRVARKLRKQRRMHKH